MCLIKLIGSFTTKMSNVQEWRQLGSAGITVMERRLSLFVTQSRHIFHIIGILIGFKTRSPASPPLRPTAVIVKGQAHVCLCALCVTYHFATMRQWLAFVLLQVPLAIIHLHHLKLNESFPLGKSKDIQ